MEAPYASVLIPTHNPGPQIDRVLESIFAQEVDFAFEVIVVDSGSSHSDVELMRQYGVQLTQIDPSDFGHGRTRNLLASLARGRVLLYLSQDAEPAHRDWMQTLLEPLEDSSVAGCYARQLPRPEADPLISFFLARTYGPHPTRRHISHGQPLRIDEIFFSNVSSAIRRDVWQRVPFRDSVIMSEDQYWAHDTLRSGYDVVYHPAARVYHSHNYSLRALYRRNWQSGASLRGLIADPPHGIAARGLKYIANQAAYLLRGGHLRWVPYMFVYEATKALGFSMGMRFGESQV